MNNHDNIKKIVLAYSGGLDTSIIIPWLKENYNNPEIIAVAGNVGQADELEGLEAKAIATGASKLIVADLAVSYTHLRAHETLMKIIAPWREWDIKSRDEEIDFAEAHHVPLKISRETNYSKDKNLWHLSHEGLDLEDPANEPNYEKPGFLEMGVSPLQAPDVPTYVTIDFEAGAPVAVDGEKMKASKIIEKLNQLGGANGIGIIDIVENRLVGMKDRGVYETPGGTILYFAHEQLEMLTVDKDTLHVKQKLAVDYADLIYNGKWYSPLQEALTAFANESNKYVTGSVKLKLYKGNIIPAGTTSPYSLYSENLVTFGESDYDQNQAAGFINLWGLPTKVQALREQGKL